MRLKGRVAVRGRGGGGEGCWPAIDADADDDSYCNVGSDWRKADRCMKEERRGRLRAGREGGGRETRCYLAIKKEVGVAGVLIRRCGRWYDTDS